MYFSADNLVLTVAQAACIALPAAGLPPWTERFRTRAWALVLPLSIVVVVGGIALVPSAADVLTWVALLLVPPGCALALGWAIRGARPVAALAAVPLLVLAWTLQDSRVGQLAAAILIAGSAVTAGRLLAGAAPLTLLRAGVVVMAIVDAYLVFSNQLQPSNDVLVTAAPAPGLPQLQSASFGLSGLGYGDFFAAAVVGGILAVQRSPRLVPAIAMVVVSLAWDQLFLIYDVLPATIPPALVLVGVEGWRRRRAAHASTGRRVPTGRPRQRRPGMGDGSADEAKGRLKEAGGSLTGDRGLKNEGKVDRAAGSVKDAVGDVADKAKDVVNKD